MLAKRRGGGTGWGRGVETHIMNAWGLSCLTARYPTTGEEILLLEIVAVFQGHFREAKGQADVRSLIWKS